LARAAGVSFDAVSRTERAQTTPSLEVLERMAKALRVSIPALIGAEGVSSAYSPDAMAVARLIDDVPKARRARVRRALEVLLRTSS
jgi:transcriptional regulator with XRE-family HTH domain